MKINRFQHRVHGDTEGTEFFPLPFSVISVSPRSLCRKSFPTVAL